MAFPAAHNFLKLKDTTIAYWLRDPRLHWPMKVISGEHAATLGATIGSVVPVLGCVVSAKFVLGQPLLVAERIFGLKPGELNRGAVLLRLNRLPYTDEFDWNPGHTNLTAYNGFRHGMESNQWILTADVPATIVKIAGQSQTL